jgi:N-acetylneuraminic acid mutarotase
MGRFTRLGAYVNGMFSNIVEMYDPETDTWITKTLMPIYRSGFGIAVYSGKIFIFGGSGYNIGSELIGVTQVYDPATDTWENRSSIPTLRDGLCANVVNNKIYLIGGNSYYGAGSWPTLCDENEVYDPETDTWTTAANIPNYVNYAISDLTSVVVDSKIHLLSGPIDQMNDIPPTEPFHKVYDPETDTWSNATMMPLLVSGLAGATTGSLAPKRIHLFSGGTHQIYDPEKDSWVNGTLMPTERYGFGLAVLDDKFYVMGGNTQTITAGSVYTYPSTANEQYTPADYIPEFPAWVMLPLLLVVSLFVVLFKKRLTCVKSGALKQFI